MNVAPATITISSNPANICPGTTSTLQVSGSGPGPWTYTWSNSSNNNTITSNFATIVSATIQNNAGCLATTTYSLGSSTSLSLTATSNPLALCVGGTASVSVTGASTYTWSNGSTTSSVIAVTPTATTVYSVFGVVGTCTGLTTYTLIVNRIPTITIVASATSVCAGGTVSLTANGANNYTWTPGNYTTSTIVSPTLSGTALFQVRGLNQGCAARTNSISITVAPSPVVNIISSSTLACNGDVISLTAFGATSYTWSTGGNGPVTIQSPSVSTTYSVVGANNNNCINSAVVTVSVNACTGLKNVSNNQQLLVYPNPSKGMIHLQGSFSGELNLMNEFGQLIKTFKLDATNNEMLIDGLSHGIYFVLSKDKSIQQKIIIMP